MSQNEQSEAVVKIESGTLFDSANEQHSLFRGVERGFRGSQFLAIFVALIAEVLSNNADFPIFSNFI